MSSASAGLRIKGGHSSDTVPHPPTTRDSVPRWISAVEYRRKGNSDAGKIDRGPGGGGIEVLQVVFADTFEDSHDDGTTNDFVWVRADAEAILAATAGPLWKFTAHFQ